MSLSSLIQALRSEFYVARYALGARLLILLPSAAAAFQFIASKISDTGTAARDSLMNSNSFDDAIASNAWGHFVDGLDTGITLLFLLLVAQAAHSFSAELESGALQIIHGSTVATNATLEGKVARTAYVTNSGFADTLRLARQTRPQLYALEFEPVDPPVPPDVCH